MVVATALVSVLVVPAPQQPQSPPPDPPPAYTLSGVRRAAAPASPSSETPQTAAPQPAAPEKPIKKEPSGRELVVDTQVKGDAVPLPRDNGLVTTSMAPAGPSWHEEFLAMSQPRPGTGPYDGFVNSADRALGVATSVAFALAIQEAVALVGSATGAYKDWKLNKLRTEIDGERQIVDQLFQASQASAPIRK